MQSDKSDTQWTLDTQKALGNIIQRPKLSTKYLLKPPVRFLIDIFMAVERVTGFAQGLYTAEERDGRSYQSKREKIKFFNKAISIVEVALSVELDVSASKITAGVQPEMTNCWLQMLAVAATSCLDRSNEAVERVLDAVCQYPTVTERGRLHVGTLPRIITLSFALDGMAIIGTALSGDTLFCIAPVACLHCGCVTFRRKIAEALGCENHAIELLEEDRYLSDDDVISNPCLIVVKQMVVDRPSGKQTSLEEQHCKFCDNLLSRTGYCAAGCAGVYQFVQGVYTFTPITTKPTCKADTLLDQRPISEDEDGMAASLMANTSGASKAMASSGHDSSWIVRKFNTTEAQLSSLDASPLLWFQHKPDAVTKMSPAPGCPAGAHRAKSRGEFIVCGKSRPKCL